MTISKTMRRLQCVVTVAQYHALAAESKRTGASMTELVRRAIDKAHPAPKRGKP